MSAPWRRFSRVVGFELALLALAAALGRVTPLLLTIVVGASVFETYRLARGLRAGTAPPGAAPRTTPAPAPPPAPSIAAPGGERQGVRGMDLAADGDPWNLTARVAEAERLDPEGLQMGAVALAHPDELVPYVDVGPSNLDGFDWVVDLYDEVRLFVDDDALSDVEGDDALESRFAAAAGIARALREDREIIHLAAPGVTAGQVHALAVTVLTDAAHATQRLRSES